MNAKPNLIVLIIACIVLISGCAPKRIDRPPSGPAVRGPNDAIPADLDIAVRVDLEKRKAIELNPALRELDRISESYAAGVLPFGSYVEALASKAGVVSAPVKDFLIAYRLEKALDLPRVLLARRACAVSFL